MNKCWDLQQSFTWRVDSVITRKLVQRKDQKISLGLVSLVASASRILLTFKNESGNKADSEVMVPILL